MVTHIELSDARIKAKLAAHKAVQIADEAIDEWLASIMETYATSMTMHGTSKEEAARGCEPLDPEKAAVIRHILGMELDQLAEAIQRRARRFYPRFGADELKVVATVRPVLSIRLSS